MPITCVSLSRGLLSRGSVVARLWLIGAVMSCLCLSGCVGKSRRSMTQFLPSVSQTWWPGTRDESIEQAEPEEPSVTANVATAVDSSEAARDENASSLHGLAHLRLKPLAKGSAANGSVTAQGSGRVTLPPTEHERQAARRELAAANSTGLPQADDNGDQLERLKAALNEDARRTASENPAVTVSSDARARVESLLDRARRLFDVGQLTDARQTAQMAQDLGETARLDFSPEEERPIDLVHQIDDQLQATQATVGDDAQQETARNDIAAINPTKTTPANAGAEDTNGRSWLRGRSINVFRRDAKPSANEPSPVTSKASVQIKAGPTRIAADLTPDIESGVQEVTDSHVAVVQANRSMALARSGSSAHSVRDDFAVADTDRERNESGLPTDLSAGLSAREVEGQGADRTTASWTESTARAVTTEEAFASRNNLASETVPQLLVDDAETTPPALEEVRPMSPFRNVARTGKPARLARAERDEPRVTATAWAIASAALIVCSLLAVTFYRR